MASMDAGARALARPSGNFALSSRARQQNRIDWRRSAKDERLYVREREWEAAHTVYLWIDRSASMWFTSGLALQSKIDRALVLALRLLICSCAAANAPDS